MLNEEDSNVNTKQKKKLYRRYGPPVVDGFVQGWVGFELTTVHGIPSDIIEAILLDKSMEMDWDDYNTRMEEFRQLSRDKSKPMGLRSS